MGRRRGSTVVGTALGWVQKKPKMVQAALAASVAVFTLAGLHFCLDTDYFFVVSEIAYSIGLLLLVYKLTTHKNCSGLSLRTQEVSAIFLVARVICAAVSELEVDLHIILDSVSLLSASWVIYTMRYKLQSTYIKELDNMRVYYLVVPCCVLALLINPGSGLPGFPLSLTSVLWAFCTYLESVSVLPQLRLIQNAKMVEPFTAHYVFALGVARFFGFGHWVLMIYETGGKSIVWMARPWYLWLPMNMLAEIVQTFILADFCYYYIISVIRGKKMVLPSPV